MESDKSFGPQASAPPGAPYRFDLPAPNPDLRRPDHLQSAPAGTGTQSLAAQRAGLELRAGDALQAQGELEKAMGHYLAAVQLQPQVAEHHARVGMGFWHRGDGDRARQFLQRAIELKPTYPEAHEALGQLLKEAGQIELALSHARRAVELAPDHLETLISLGHVLEGGRRSDEAWQIAQSALSRGHESPRLALLVARLASRYGAERQALHLVERVLARPSPYQREIASLHFAAAGLLDKLQQYDQAFAHLHNANNLCRAQFDCSGLTRYIDRTIAYFTPAKVQSLARSQVKSDRPLFIVGMPRSGTTLVEQILASHPAVHGGGELTWMWRIAEDAAQFAGGNSSQLPERLDRLKVEQLDELASRYLAALSQLDPSALRVSNKLPANFLHLGLIRMLFPNARIIHCRRDAMDTCLSCYFADFSSGNLFSFDLRSVGEYYQQYERLMAHWHAVLPIPILSVHYEQLVREMPSETRRMLDFLGLPWNERCLHFHENPRAVSTLSSQQVRQPIYQSSIGRWKNYQEHLQPLSAALRYQES